MRARLAISALLACGALLVAGVPAMAQGLDSSGNAGQQQYGNKSTQGVIGEIETQTPTQTTPTQTATTPPPVQTTAPTETSGQLPFTGFAAVTVLLLGAALLAGGLTLRRTTRRQTDA